MGESNIKTSRISEHSIKLVDILLINVCFVMNIFIFAPFTIYRTNVKEFSFGFFEMLLVLIIPLAVILFVSMTISIIIPNKLKEYYIALLFACSILFWIQGNFLVRDYGLLSGNQIEWSRYIWQGWLDGIIWVLFIILSIVMRKKLIKITSLISISFILIQIILLSVMGMMQGENFWIKNHTNYKEVPNGIYEYSSSKNVIHIVLDSFQTDIFLELVKESKADEDFDGFTIYRENMANVPVTTLSLPTIFSGEIYDGKENQSTFFERSISKNGFQNNLKENNYDINIVSAVKMPELVYANQYNIPDNYGGTMNEGRFQSSAYLIDVSLFRHLPHTLKPFIYNKGNWRLSRAFTGYESNPIVGNLLFLDNYLKSIKTTEQRPKYHFLHIYGAHSPYVYDNNGKYAGKVLPQNRENYKNQARKSFDYCVELVAKLKGKGIYDSSLIIIQGDHGSEFTPLIDGTEKVMEIARVPALLAVKPPFANGPLNISFAQTMLSDIPATVMGILGIKNNYQGIPVNKIDENITRERYFVYPHNINNKRILDKYDVNGSIFEKNSWSKTNSIVNNDKSALYAWGSEILFGTTGNAENYQGEGWSTPLNNYEWNDGVRALLNFNITAPNADVLLQAKVMPFITAGKVNKQRVNIIVNDTKVGEWAFDKSDVQDVICKIPGSIIKSGNMKVMFEMPDAISPTSLKMSVDERMLAIAFISLTLSEDKNEASVRSSISKKVEDYNWGDTITFGSNGNFLQYVVSGWDTTENNICWSVGEKATFVIPVKATSSDIVLKANAAAFISPGKIEKQNVEIFVNGEKIGNWEMNKSSFEERSINIPNRLIKDNYIQVDMRLPNAASPQKLGLSGDERTLGICLASLQLLEN